MIGRDLSALKLFWFGTVVVCAYSFVDITYDYVNTGKTPVFNLISSIKILCSYVVPLLFFMAIRHITTSLRRADQLEAAGEAAMRQAENASKTARTLMNATETSEEVAGLNKQIEKLKSELKSANTDRDTLKKQSEGLQREFDRVSDLLASNDSKGLSFTT